MNYPFEIQSFLKRLFSSEEPIQSTAKKEPDDEAGTFNLTVTKSIDGTLATVDVKRNDLNAEVTPSDITEQFDSPQAFLDAVVAFIEDPVNSIEVTDGVIVNTRET